ncbi:glycosyltransferase family 2 protein [Humibacter sp. RRB41]|uniref:glycosyltransferase family 2 protein n=1 Tax=Humibacter sp. RRB41 TaxID=2919946 RepID=UPI001FAA3766|nr:glycosyltransferase [Humibacter sp. RRB41]
MTERVAPAVGVVVLTQGTRPVELARALASVLAQRDVVVDIVCVGNGWQPTGLPAGVQALGLTENIGIPAGRNAGVTKTVGEYLFFLDDDEYVESETFLIDAIARFDADASLGVLQPRVRTIDDSPAPRRWVPRLRKGDPATPGAVFALIEGAILIPRSVFDAAGGWAAPFFYAHEGIELAWRVWDQGKRAWYAGDLEARHPNVPTTRHTDFYWRNARNRVWVARRNLPAVLVPIYVATWTGVQMLRSVRSPGTLKPWFTGWAAGWRDDPGERRPMRWRTVWRMAAAGRPPVV